MKKKALMITILLGIILWAGWKGPRPVTAQWIVHDPTHTALHAAQWAAQLERMLAQIEQLQRRVRQWDEDFTALWGRRGGRLHDALRTVDQIVYAGQRPWHDRLTTGEAIYSDLNRTTRDPNAGFAGVRAVRDGFTVIRPTLDRYPVPLAVREYYRALGNLSSEGLYVSARTYDAGETLGRDAQRLNEYARDTSPAGAAKTAAFAASVGVHAQGYQLETLNRLLRQAAYTNMKHENDQRMALMAAAGLQEALVNVTRELPARTHLID